MINEPESDDGETVECGECGEVAAVDDADIDQGPDGSPVLRCAFCNGWTIL